MFKKIEIFEPAMCCPSGLCGPGIDGELLRLSTMIESLSQKGIIIKRYNLTSDPQEFVSNNLINEKLSNDGIDVFPITLVDGTITKSGSYPTLEDISEWLGVYVGTKTESKTKNNAACC